MNENSDQEDSPKLSRRDFLKQAGLVMGAVLLGEWGLGKLIKQTPDLLHAESLALTPEIVDGVEVYGLREKIVSDKMVDGFYAYLDDKFAKSVNTRLVNRINQRKEFLDQNERYLEVVVRRSAYESFIKRQIETGVSFPEWIKIHVDVMNRCLKKIQPSVEMKAVLRRIVVVEDESTKSFWDENAFRQENSLGSAFDSAWVKRFWSFTFDTDESWAVADDYRGSSGSNFWEFRHENGKTIIGSPPGKVPYDRCYEFPEENDSLSGKNNISFDMGLVHEWSHYLLNLPDEYGQDVHDGSARFKSFTIGTGNLGEPFVSPHLEYLLKENIKNKTRDIHSGGMVKDYPSVRPKKIEVTTQFEDANLHSNRVEVSRVRYQDRFDYGAKSVPEKADQVSEGNSLIFDRSLFGDKSNCWLVKTGADRTAREVYLPVAAFNMSKIAGLESARYSIVFSGYDDPERTWQELKYVDEKDINGYLRDSQDPYYAKMKIGGTSTWMVWFLRAKAKGV